MGKMIAAGKKTSNKVTKIVHAHNIIPDKKTNFIIRFHSVCLLWNTGEKYGTRSINKTRTSILEKLRMIAIEIGNKEINDGAEKNYSSQKTNT